MTIRNFRGRYRFCLQEILEENGTTLAQFARDTELDYRTVSGIAKNHYRRIGLDTLYTICETLKIEPGELFWEEPGD